MSNGLCNKKNRVIREKLSDIHICGYVNITEQRSVPIETESRGIFTEVITRGAFRNTVNEENDIQLIIDHQKNCVVASRASGTLQLFEDAIGLYAHARIKNPDVIRAAQQNKIRGWSFSFRPLSENTILEKGCYPLRRINDLTLTEISLVINGDPYYPSATSWKMLRGRTLKQADLMFESENSCLMAIKMAQSGSLNRIN